MGEFLTAKDFLIWLTSAGGIGVAVPFIVNIIKRYWKIEGDLAFVVTAVVAVFVGGLCTALLEFEVYKYIEDYWGLIVAIVVAVGGGVVSLGSSQAIYHLAPRTGGEDCKE